LQDIVYTASHDLRSPLINIDGFSSVLHSDCDRLAQLLTLQDGGQCNRDKVDEILSEAIPASLNYIKCGAKKMSSLLDGLLQISRVGTIEISSETIDMDKTIGEVLAAMEYQIKESGITVKTESLVECKADANMVNIVFSNLIGNAIKYRDPEKEGEIVISGSVLNGMSVYCVQDNGIGIEEEHQGRVFEIFHRLNPDNSTEGEGLGLTIVTRILNRLGGNIRLDSEAGKGSKFHVELPSC
jgi:signal transduction histidine kinase